jgi:lipopolysaccharide export LptBFGC system permease protein LptF
VAEPTPAQVRQLNRLLDEENRERDERRGLENRMTGLTASSLVVLGLIANAAATGRVKHSIATALLLLAGFLVVLGLVRITGWQKTPESFAEWRKTNGPPLPADDIYPLNMPRLAEDDPQSALEEQLRIIQFLREQNKRRLRYLHRASQMFFLAVAVIFIGVLAFLVG